MRIGYGIYTRSET